MAAYYNEHDKFAAAWLRELIKENLIAPGDVDERSIKEVQPEDLRGYTQCHFFGGIGGWSLALRLAGWSDDTPVWTGSCPCQPFSCIGKGAGVNDERHLWPEMYRLMQECRPAIAFGEQVPDAVRHGWLDGVFDDLEGIGYACGACDLPACSVGSPMPRQRIWWVADSNFADAHERTPSRKQSLCVCNDSACRVADSEGENVECVAKSADGDEWTGEGESNHGEQTRRRGIAGNWGERTIQCRDGVLRRFEPESFPLVDGFPCRLDLIRGYGNAIVAELAAKFIQAHLECRA